MPKLWSTASYNADAMPHVTLTRYFKHKRVSMMPSLVDKPVFSCHSCFFLSAFSSPSKIFDVTYTVIIFPRTKTRPVFQIFQFLLYWGRWLLKGQRMNMFHIRKFPINRKYPLQPELRRTECRAVQFCFFFICKQIHTLTVLPLIIQRRCWYQSTTLKCRAY